MLLGKSVLMTLLRQRSLELCAPTIDPSKPLPHTFDYFSIRIELGARP